MEDFTATTLIFSIIITWTIGLLPPLLIRYAFLRRPMTKKSAIGISAIFWFLNIILFTAMGSKSKTHTALLLIAYVSYWILRREKKASISQSPLATPITTVEPDIQTTVGNTSSQTSHIPVKTLGKVAAVIGILVVLVFAKGIGKIISKSTIDNFNEGRLEGAIEKTLLETSKQINAQLPMMVDEETRLDTTICAGNHMNYKYTLINLSDKDVDKKVFHNEVRKVLVKNQCGNANMVKMLKMGVSYDYMYQDRDGNIVAIVNVSKKDCGF